MIHTLAWFVGLALVLSTAASSSPPTSAPAMVELFNKEISPGQRIIITRQPLDVMRLGVLDTTLSKQGAQVAVLRVELQVDRAPPVLIGSAIQSDFPDFRQGMDVLGVFPGQNELIVACATRDQLGLWRIRLDLHWHLPDGWAWIGLRTMYAAPPPVQPGEVSVTMSPLPEGRWDLTITDTKSRKPKTHWKQVEGQWAFRPAAD